MKLFQELTGAYSVGTRGSLNDQAWLVTLGAGVDDSRMSFAGEERPTGMLAQRIYLSQET